MENTEKKGVFERIYDWFKGLTVRGLLGAILVAFVILIIISSVSFLPSIISKISSSFSAALYSVFVPAENATMTADKSIVNSGEDFTVSFKNTNTAPTGIFTVSYACDASVNLVSVEANGLKTIDCNKPYYLVENEKSIKIRPTTQDSLVRLVLQGGFENNDTQKTDGVGVVRVTVRNASAGLIVNSTTTVATSSTVTNTSTYVPPTYTAPVVQPVYYGKPDLAVRMLQVGLLSPSTNLITTQSQFSAMDMVGIKFEVRNDGDANTGIWAFTANLPSVSTPIYNSGTEISLKPGESIIFTLGFSNLTSQYTGVISVSVDPLNVVSESNESNNIVTSTITNINYNNNYYNNNNYNSGCYINGVYTYNCNNNYNYNYNYNGNYNNGNLTASCYASNNNALTGQALNWNPVVSGGNGSYSYYWSGTDNLSSSSQYPSMTYYSAGYKYAYLTITSGGYTATANCSTDVGNNNYYNNNNGWNNNSNTGCYINGVYIANCNNNYNYNNNYNGTLGVTCNGSPSNTVIGNNVYWSANAYGGNGNYNYNWSGTDGLYGSYQNVNKSYSYTGTKSATVTVTSNGYSVSQTCYINVN